MPGFADPMCGAHCLWLVASAEGKARPLVEVAHLADMRPPKGMSLLGLVRGARRMGMEAEAVETDMDALSRDPRRAILLLSSGEEASGHYVLLDDLRPTEVEVIDGRSVRTLTRQQLRDLWSGYAVLIGAKPKGRLSWRVWPVSVIGGVCVLLSVCVCRMTRRRGGVSKPG